MDLKRDLEHIKKLFRFSDNIEESIDAKLEDTIKELEDAIKGYGEAIDGYQKEIEQLEEEIKVLKDESQIKAKQSRITQLKNVVRVFTTELDSAKKRLSELQVKLAREKLSPEIEKKIKESLIGLFKDYQDALANISAIFIRPTMPTPEIEIRMRKARGREITFLLEGHLPAFKKDKWTLRPIKFAIKGGSATVRFVLNLHNTLVAFMRREGLSEKVINYLNTIKDKTHIAEIKHQDWVRDLDRTDIGIKGTIAYKISQYLPEGWKIQNFYEEGEIDDNIRLELNTYDITTPENQKLLSDIGFAETLKYIRYETSDLIDEENTVQLDIDYSEDKGVEYITL